MSTFDDEVLSGSAEIFLEASTEVVVTAPGSSAQPGLHAILDRSVAVTDDYGVVMERRCEIALMIAEVGDVGRGTVVDTGKPDDRWQLLEPIGDDGFETRWTAGKV